MSSTSSIRKITPEDPAFPAYLQHIGQPPAQLYIASHNWENILLGPKVAVVGSRKVSAYGKAVTEMLVSELVRAGVIIVSGLAYGVDALAHRTALQAGGLTVAILPASLAKIYPAGHTQLAAAIVERGGALLSEYEIESTPRKWSFVERNRLVSGIADALLVTEAASKSGTLHTANFALEQGKEVFAVPGNITSVLSEGTNGLIKMGAALTTSASDILSVLGITVHQKTVPRGGTPAEQAIIDAIAHGDNDGAVLLAHTALGVQHFNQALTMLEIRGIVRAAGGNQWHLC